MSRSRLHILALLTTGLMLGLMGCSSRPYYSNIPEPVVPEPGAGTPARGAAAHVYTVKRGDTLHSIAFAAGTDWVTLARLNGISAPYTIYPGQRLRVTTATPGQAAASRPSAVPATRTAPSSSPSATVPHTAPPAATALPAIPGGWHWPGSGRLLQGFTGGTDPHKGIDIGGKLGDPVVAARGGTVVYAGSGVRGYGNLLIIKHDVQWLSAYAHNSKLLVAEGQTVQAGQRIAEMGDSGTDRVKLHFEVRRQGNPVDPLQVLPRR